MQTKKPSLKKQLINIGFLLLLIGFTFFIIFHNNDGFSLRSLEDFVSKIHWPFLLEDPLAVFARRVYLHVHEYRLQGHEHRRAVPRAGIS